MADVNPVAQPETPHSSVSAYQFGRFRIDVADRHLLRDGEVMLLTTKAFETLLLLVTHRDRVVTKDELMQAVWPNTFVSDDSLTQAISSVRRALGDAEFIATIPRRGYKFILPVTELGDASTSPALPREAAAEMPQTAAILHSGEHAADIAIDAPRRHTGRKWMPAVLSAATLAAGVLIGATLINRPAAETSQAALRFTQAAPAGTHIVSGGILSPDGAHIAFVASDISSGTRRLWVRALTSTEAVALPGTENAERPFWSPDSRSLGFVGNSKIKTVSLNGEMARSLANVRSHAAGATWGPNLIVFSNWRSGLDAVAPWGGQPSAFTTLDLSLGDTQHQWPQFLPDGRHYLFYIASTRPSRAGVYVGTIGSSDPIRLLDSSHGAAIYAPPGYLVYVRDGSLMAQRFNAERLQLEGEPTSLASNVSPPSVRNSAMLSASAGGLLAFGGGTSPRRLAWFTRHGDRVSTIETPTALNSPALSADEKKLLAMSIDNNQAGVWLVDLERGTPNRLVPDGAMAMLSPEGDMVAFVSNRGSGVTDLFVRRLAGRGEDERLLQTNEFKFVNDWTKDGRYIVYASSNAKTGEDVWLLPTFGDRQPIAYLRTEFNEIQSRVSPDGRWVAYASNESGEWEVYVQSFPQPGSKQLISIRGGAEPVWRRDGRELYYLATDRTLMAVEVSTVGQNVKFGRPVALFRPALSGSLNNYRSHYAVTADGKRFVIDAIDADTPQESITVISNWTTLVGGRR